MNCWLEDCPAAARSDHQPLSAADYVFAAFSAGFAARQQHLCEEHQLAADAAGADVAGTAAAGVDVAVVAAVLSAAFAASESGSFVVAAWVA